MSSFVPTKVSTGAQPSLDLIVWRCRSWRTMLPCLRLVCPLRGAPRRSAELQQRVLCPCSLCCLPWAPALCRGSLKCCLLPAPAACCAAAECRPGDNRPQQCHELARTPWGKPQKGKGVQQELLSHLPKEFSSFSCSPLCPSCSESQQCSCEPPCSWQQLGCQGAEVSQNGCPLLVTFLYPFSKSMVVFSPSWEQTSGS